MHKSFRGHIVRDEDQKTTRHHTYTHVQMRSRNPYRFLLLMLFFS